MNREEIEQVLSGEKKVEVLPDSSAEIIFEILTEKFQAKYNKLIHGFKMDNRPNSPIHFGFTVEHYKSIRFTIFSDHSWHEKEVTKIGIRYEDAGTHHGNAYGNQTNEVIRYTSVKQLAKLIPKMEEIYGFLEAEADKHREKEIEKRIKQLQDSKKEKLDQIEIDINEIISFRTKYSAPYSQLTNLLADLIDEKATQKIAEEEKLKKLPEFTDPRKVLGL